jgi:hypothetical protein
LTQTKDEESTQAQTIQNNASKIKTGLSLAQREKIKQQEILKSIS